MGGHQDEASEEDEEVQSYGWKVKLNHVFRESRNQNFRPRYNQFLPLLVFSFRYVIFWLKLWWKKILPFIDGIRTLKIESHYGVPIGGIGSGSIGRGFRGEFCRYHMIPGIYQHNIVYANQFIITIRKRGKTVYQQVLSTYRPGAETFPYLTSWNWGFNGAFADYRGLYPQSWTKYDLPGQNVTLMCRQISPIIPHNYKESCLPAAVFEWTVKNTNSGPIDVGITFTFKNGVGEEDIDKAGGCWTENFTKNEQGISVKGISLHQKFNNTMHCSYNIASKESSDVVVSHCLNFDPCGTGEELWSDLLSQGKFSSNSGKSKVTNYGEEIACAVNAFTTVDSHRCNKFEFTLSWDMPKIHFRGQLLTHKRTYTRWFGDEGNAGPALCHYAIKNHKQWERDINSWQKPVLENTLLEDWYKSAIFNELYFLTDGGSLWLEMPPSESQRDARHEYGRFAYLESHEYRMYNTYDVHFYASFALIMLWPKLQLSLQYDFAETIPKKSTNEILFLMEGKYSLRKTENTIPHDLGDPEGEPWVTINGYHIHDVSKWKDLNVKFVLQVYRDYAFTKDEVYLKDMWPSVILLMEKSLTFDRDNDGLIENDGCADQTFDTWIMKGPSSYCGGLWLSALSATVEMARIVKHEESITKYSEILEKGKKSFDDKLWTGSYYKFDCSNGRHSNSIMADQLCGHWYHKACLTKEPSLPQDKVSIALKTIFDNNVMKNKNGTCGAVNGMTPDGQIDLFTLQSEETWIGVTYALAANLIQEGFFEEGMITAKGMYRTIYEDLGLQYQTPEAIYQKDYCRAPGYMRALAIWGIQWAIENR